MPIFAICGLAFISIIHLYSMKKDIHPKYYPEAKIICACGNIITTGSTRPEMKVEVCSACHPFYTGKKRLVDSAGRLDRFKKRFEKTAEMKAGLAKKQAVKGKKKKAKLVIEKKISKKKIAKKTAAKKVIKKK